MCCTIWKKFVSLSNFSDKSSLCSFTRCLILALLMQNLCWHQTWYYRVRIKVENNLLFKIYVSQYFKSMAFICNMLKFNCTKLSTVAVYCSIQFFTQTIKIWCYLKQVCVFYTLAVSQIYISCQNLFSNWRKINRFELTSAGQWSMILWDLTDILLLF